MKGFEGILGMLTLIIVSMTAVLTVPAASAAGNNEAFVIPVKGEIGPAVSEFVVNEIDGAVKSGVPFIILEIDTSGGKIESAFKIKDAVNEAISRKVQVITFVNGKAENAGVMVTMLGQRVVMTPESILGPAEINDFYGTVNSFWADELKNIVESRGKNSDIVAAMTDRSTYINGVKEKGKPLYMTSEMAKKFGICDFIADSLEDVRGQLGFADMELIEKPLNFKIRAASVLSNRSIAYLLLILGMIGLVVEVSTPASGIAAILGTILLSMYFTGSILSGRSDIGGAVLFAAGLLLLVIEAAIPGFGAAGTGGIISLTLGIIISAGNIISGLMLILLVIISLLITIWLLYKYAPRSSTFKKIIMESEIRTGYHHQEVDNKCEIGDDDHGTQKR